MAITVVARSAPFGQKSHSNSNSSNPLNSGTKQLKSWSVGPSTWAIPKKSCSCETFSAYPFVLQCTQRQDSASESCGVLPLLYFKCFAKNAAPAEYAASQSRCKRKSWISSGKTSSSTSTFCLRRTSASCTVWENCTLRSSSP